MSLFDKEVREKSPVFFDEEDIVKEEERRTKEQAEVSRIDTETKLKKKLAYKTFSFMERFVNFIGILLIVYVAHFIANTKEIPKEVMIALITTTLAAVVGLVGFILKGLFGSK